VLAQFVVTESLKNDSFLSVNFVPRFCFGFRSNQQRNDVCPNDAKATIHRSVLGIVSDVSKRPKKLQRKEIGSNFFLKSEKKYLAIGKTVWVRFGKVF
jgi:hypothetical protein